jgi:hypothetical protein
MTVQQSGGFGGRPTTILLHCPTGDHRCLDELALRVGGRTLATVRATLAAGSDRLIRARIPAAKLRSIGVGRRMTIVVHARFGRRAAVLHQGTRLLAPSTIDQGCPAPTVQAGSPVSVSGSVLAAPIARTSSAATRHMRVGRVAVVATSPLGQLLVLQGHVDARGRFSVVLVPNVAGRWTLESVWNGDAKHLETTSRSCNFTAQPPPPAPTPTTTTVTCPAQAIAGSPVTLNGALLPYIQGAQVKISYVLEGNPAHTITDTATVTTGGNFTDTAIPDLPGTWQAQASYAGDPTHLPSTSQACTFTAAPIPTALTLTCPSKASLNKALQITGTLTPALAGAQITLTYTHQTQGPLETITNTVTTDATGNYTDTSTIPNDVGQWNVTASYPGDSTHAPATSQTCTTAVS